MKFLKIHQTINTRQYSLPIKVIYNKYPKFRQYVNPTNYKIDLGNSESLRAYNQLLFKELEGLDILIPKGHLIPTAGLRRAIVQLVLKQNPRVILEIGTGATAIVSQLLAKKGIKVMATELDPMSFQYALENIERNKQLFNFPITLIKSNGEIIKGLKEINSGIFFDGIVSLPPYYDIDSKRKKYEKGFSGTHSELFFGKFENFGKRLLEEAIQMPNKPIFVGILWKNSENMFTILNELQLNDKSVIYKLAAGTRERFFSFVFLG